MNKFTVGQEVEVVHPIGRWKGVILDFHLGEFEYEYLTTNAPITYSTKMPCWAWESEVKAL